jgi:hypothetical protein
VDDAVGAGEMATEIVADHVGGNPARPWQLKLGPPAGEADDLVNRRVSAQRADDAGPEIPRRAGDNDPHQVLVPAMP